MNPEKRPTLEDRYPLPRGMKVRLRKFGVNPGTPMKAVRGGSQQASAQAELPFQLRWEDSTLALTVLIHADPATGRLVGDVVCTDTAMLNKASVSVALVGKHDHTMIRKTVKLDQPDNHNGGCCGTADFGLLSDAIHTLGTELGLVVFMLV